MSNTKAVHVRFWQAMLERFGSRWISEYGKEPTKSWVDLLDRFTPEAISGALDLLKDRRDQERPHPPTHAEFESLLGKAAAKLKSGSREEYVRGYWRSVINATILRHAALLRIVPWGTSDLPALQKKCEDAYRSAVRKGAELLDWACDTEHKSGQRTPGLEQHINTELWELLKLWRRDLDGSEQAFALTATAT